MDLLTSEMPPDVEYHLLGSWRRKAKVIGDLDILVVTENGELNGSLFESGVNLPRSVDWQRSGPKVAQGDLWLGDDAIHVDVWSCKPNERGAYLCFATGPVELNLLQRQRAIRMGYALSQIGLLDRETKWQLDNGTEEDIYRWIDMDFLTPEQREKFTKPKQATPKPYPQMTRRPIVSETTTPATRPTRKPAAKKAAEKPAPQVTEAPAPEPVTDASIEIGGVSVTVRQAKEALLALTAAKSMFVKQPLAAKGHPLAACDYHAVAAIGFEAKPDLRKGKHPTKTAFIEAVKGMIAEAESGGSQV
ncbi:hypothetical protein J2S43_003742 [Catenuloplanes nepalensis]|uniref:DNA polymerase beta thumb domain-containing protein n=1 Tax=Catenuloplanes nepalensis TaxID=587533 RepID=A0ABT9MUV6_9ACTN|nr:hypothetical protein [Catenuloplanes nepalensis]MDP9795230.1 hypothetical protein [Catenuloplanes nepalensis]